MAERNAEVDIVKLYNEIQYYANSRFCTFPLPENTVFRPKSSTQINGKLLHIKQQS